jgi:NAD+ synthase
LTASEVLIEKVRTADREENRLAQPDEVALGMTYEQIDDYLEGKSISEASQEKLETQ